MDLNAIQTHDISINPDDETTIINEQKKTIMQLTAECDCDQQKIYSLEKRLEIRVNLERELQERHEELEQALAQHQTKLQELQEIHGKEKKELESRINKLECELDHKVLDNNKLQEIVNTVNKKLETLSAVQPIVEVNQIDDSSALRDQVEQLKELLSQQHDEFQRTRADMEQTNEDLKTELKEVHDILKDTKEQLMEKNAALEMNRDELMECRAELDNLKVTPASDTRKGNSLFAEVEDRRLKAYDNMVALKEENHAVKRAFNAKVNEIKTLKAENAILANKWKNDHDEIIQINADLIKKFKERIAGLELKLKDKHEVILELERKTQPTDDAYSYFISSLEEKSKKIEELEAELEHISIKGLMTEEQKHRAHRQLCSWRHKATVFETQILAVKSCCDTDATINKTEILNILQKVPRKNNDPQLEEPLDETELPPIQDESVVTLEKLMKVPKLNNTQYFNDNKYDHSITIDNEFDDHDKLNHTMDVISQSNVKMPAYSGATIHQHHTQVTAEKSILKDEKKSLSKEESREKGKKTLRFAEGTIEPQPKKVPRQAISKHPIIYVSDTPTNDEK